MKQGPPSKQAKILPRKSLGLQFDGHEGSYFGNHILAIQQDKTKSQFAFLAQFPYFELFESMPLK
jgi:hypothetical protein